MSNAFFELSRYIRHFWLSKGPKGHGVHSPLVFRLLTSVLASDKEFYVFDGLEKERQNLLEDHSGIEVLDLGAGSRKEGGNTRTIASIAKMALQDRRCCQALFKLVADLKPRTAIELGTSLGVTTAYLAKAHSACLWTTIEGSPAIAERARSLLSNLDVNNVKVVTGDFSDVLPELLEGMETLDFAVIDGNHRYEPTMLYYDMLSKKVNETTVFVFDDIHWSPEMEKAWREIIARPEVSISIDFFHFGIIWFRGGVEKQHFILRLP